MTESFGVVTDLSKRKRREKNEIVFNRALNNKREELTVPECFSIIENPEETIAFFNDIINKVTQIRHEFSGYIATSCCARKIFFIDMRAM